MSYYYKTGVIVPFVQKFYKQMIVVVAAIFVASMVAMTLSASAATSTVVVTGNTVNESLGENGSEGWWFNRDSNTSSPFEFNSEQASIGSGSLYVEPIGPTAADKFIAENFMFEEMGNVESVTYDFMIGEGGVAADRVHFNSLGKIGDLGHILV